VLTLEGEAETIVTAKDRKPFSVGDE